MESFCRKKGGAWEQLTKEKKGLFLDQDIFFFGGGGGGGEVGEEVGKGFCHADCLFFLWGIKTHRTDIWCLSRKFQTG